MSHLPKLLRGLHELSAAGRVADYRHLLTAADEIERLQAQNEALRDEVGRLERAVLTGDR